MSGLAGVRTYLTSVARVEQLTPGVRRITFAGGDLAELAGKGADQFVYVLVPPPGRDELTIDRDFTWDRYRTMPEEERPVGAYYTVRHHRPEVAEVDADFVLHGDEGAGSAFALRAQPGDPVALWGPRTLHDPPEGTASFLLVADDTGVPAASALVEQYPPGTRVVALLEVAGPEEERPLHPAPGVELDVRWLHRDGADPGTSDVLVEAARALPPLPEGTYCWGGGESRLMAAIRRELRQERGVPPELLCLTAYWSLNGRD